MPRNEKQRLRVLQLVCPGAKLLDVAGPLQVFHLAQAYTSDVGAYETLLISQSGGSIITDVGVALDTTAYHDVQVRAADLILITGGEGIADASNDKKLIAWLHANTPKCRALASTCTGAFLLGAAGYLDNRRAVTHWMACERLQAQCPKASIESDPIFIEDDGVWTSAGVTAGIDLALAIVQSDFGREVSLALARHLVVYAQRPGGQSQFSQTLRQQVNDKDSEFAALHDWIRKHLNQDLSVERLAERIGMSTRSFHRNYVKANTITPARMVTLARLEAARSLLEQTTKSIREVANQCGFGTEEQMRRSFQRELGTPPASYRQLWQPH